MNSEIENKISKIYALVNNGSTDGEKQAAKAALDRLIRKYNLSDEYVKNIHMKFYYFQYSTNLDTMIFQQLLDFYFPEKKFEIYKSTVGGKNIVCKLEYLDYVQIDCSYAYFRIHANKQFKKFCVPLIARCRTTRTKNAKRQLLQEEFFSRYVIASKLYHQHQLKQIDLNKLSDNQLKAKMAVKGVEGGTYNNQVTTGLFLTDGTTDNISC